MKAGAYARLILAGILLVLAAPTTACRTAAAFRPPTVAMHVESNRPDATVWIDDHLEGRVSDFAKANARLPVGFHRVEVRHPACYSHFQEVDPKEGEDVTIKAPLHDLVE